MLHVFSTNRVKLVVRKPKASDNLDQREHVRGQVPMMHKMVSKRKRKFVSQRKCKYSENKIPLTFREHFLSSITSPCYVYPGNQK